MLNKTKVLNIFLWYGLEHSSSKWELDTDNPSKNTESRCKMIMVMKFILLNILIILINAGTATTRGALIWLYSFDAVIFTLPKYLHLCFIFFLFILGLSEYCTRLIFLKKYIIGASVCWHIGRVPEIFVQQEYIIDLFNLLVIKLRNQINVSASIFIK